MFVSHKPDDDEALEELCERMRSAEATRKERTPSFEEALQKVDKAGSGLLTKDQFKKAL